MPVYGSVQPNVKDALGMLADWYQEGVLDRDFLIRTQDDIAELIAQGRCGIFFAPWWAPNNPLWRCHETDPEADWQPFLDSDREGWKCAILQRKADRKLCGSAKRV